jgi:hypothetical protein
MNMIAEYAHISNRVILSIEKGRLSGIKDFIASLVDERYLYPGIYLDHLMETERSLRLVGVAAPTPRPPAHRA